MKLTTLKAYAKHCETYVNRLDKNGRQYTYYQSQLDKTLEDIRLMKLGEYKPSPSRDYVTGESRAVSSKSPRRVAEKYYDQYFNKQITLNEIAAKEDVVISSVMNALYRIRRGQ